MGILIGFAGNFFKKKKGMLSCQQTQTVIDGKKTHHSQSERRTKEGFRDCHVLQRVRCMGSISLCHQAKMTR